jgi:hypothetical protein
VGAELEKVAIKPGLHAILRHLGKSHAGTRVSLKRILKAAPRPRHKMAKTGALSVLAGLRDISEPLTIGVGLEHGVQKVAGRKTEDEMDDKDLREKVASTMLRLHEENQDHTKRAHALRLIYKQAELGQSVLPQTFSEMEVKIASLVKEDLVVFEKALELAGGATKLGEIGIPDPRVELNASQQFQATILGEDF